MYRSDKDIYVLLLSMESIRPCVNMPTSQKQSRGDLHHGKYVKGVG